ncbi:hypothetical protein VNI00_009878 [Paramarasmius palmivorus]|uniref:Uncharacterized protein n=1 Tax=Paramarasmius palmivorus TaxID=297713 RepID=A0AAW0CQW4_9AGAR
MAHRNVTNVANIAHAEPVSRSQRRPPRRRAGPNGVLIPARAGLGGVLRTRLPHKLALSARTIHGWRNAISRLYYLLHAGQAIASHGVELDTTLDAVIAMLPELIQLFSMRKTANPKENQNQNQSYDACILLAKELKVFRRRTAYGDVVKNKARFILQTLKDAFENKGRKPTKEIKPVNDFEEPMRTEPDNNDGGRTMIRIR